jgi:hypothetical protein
MNITGILFFNKYGFVPNAGWAEVYFFLKDTYADAVTALQAIRDARLPTLSGDCQLVGARVSNTDVKGDSEPLTWTFPEPGTFATGTADPTAPPEIVLRALYYAGTLKRGSRWVRCIPSSQIAAGGLYTPTGPYTTAVTAYWDAVRDNACLGTRIPGAVAPPFYSLTSYTSYTPKGQDVRKIGRPFDLLRGRRLIA